VRVQSEHSAARRLPFEIKKANLIDLNAFFPTPRRTLVSTHNRRVDSRLNISFFAANFPPKKDYPISITPLRDAPLVIFAELS